MFEKSYYHVLQDYIQSGCKEQLTPEEQEYYNALYDSIHNIKGEKTINSYTELNDSIYF